MGFSRKACLVAAVVTLMGGYGFPYCGWGQETNRIGTVLVVEGTAEVRAQDAAEWERLRFRDRILLNDTVRTAEASKVKVLLRDDSIMTLGERSEMQFNEFLLTQEQRRTVVNLFIGKLRVITTRIFGLGSATEVQMPNAVAGIRGSDALFNVASPSEALVTTFSTDTEVFVRNPNFPQVQVVPPGTQSKVVGNTPPSTPTALPTDTLQGLSQQASTAPAQVPSEITGQQPPGGPPRGDELPLPPPATQELAPPPPAPVDTGLRQQEQQLDIQGQREQHLEHITEQIRPDSGNPATEETIRETLLKLTITIPR